MPIKAKATDRPIEATTTVQRDKSGVEQHREETREILGHVVETAPMCNVGFRLGRKVNLGNYESLSVEVSLHVPAGQEEVEEAFAAAREWVEAKLTEALDAYTKE